MKTKSKKPKDYKPIYVTLALFAFILPFVVGYARLKLILSGLGIYLIPNEVYGLSYIYFSGFAWLSINLLLPALAFLFGKAIAKIDFKGWQLYVMFGLIPVFLSTLQLLLPFSIRVQPPSFLYMAAKVICFLVLASFGYYWNRILKELRNVVYFFLSVMMVFWVVTHFYSSISMEKSMIRCGAPVATFALNPGLSGRLITCTPISTESEDSIDYVFGAYETKGFLINKHANSYYFIPRDVISGNSFGPGTDELCVVPEKNVIVFVQNVGEKGHGIESHDYERSPQKGLIRYRSKDWK